MRPRGHSMSGTINDGDLVVLPPCCIEDIAAGDIVLVRIQGRHHAHLVLHQVLKREDGRMLIGNNLGGVDGWVGAQDVYGRVIAVEPG